MKVLVTGHNGYIGQVMVPLLQAAGHECSGLDTYYYEECQFSDAPGGFRTIRKDIRDVTEADLEGIDAIVFLAALSNDALGDLDPTLTYDINHQATVRFAEVAKRAGVGRFLFSSSCSLYGAQGDDALTEEAELNPITPYGESKINVERDLGRMAEDSFIPTYLRNATAYGLSPSLRIDLVVNNLTAYALTTGEVLMKSDGMPWRPLVHIEDISRAFLAVMEADPKVVSDVPFNVGINEENYRIREVAEMVRDVVPDSRVEFAEGASPDLRNYRVNFDRINAALPAYKPIWTVKKGIEQLYAAYQECGLTSEDLESARYLRIKTILRHKDAGRLDPRLCWK